MHAGMAVSILTQLLVHALDALRRHGHRASQSYHTHQRVRVVSVSIKATGLFFRFGIATTVPSRAVAAKIIWIR